MFAVVHNNPNATEGDRVERYIGHTFDPKTGLAPLRINGGDTIHTIVWNENGECVRFDPIVLTGKYGVSSFDIMESLEYKDRVESKMKILGCEECNELSKTTPRS